MPRKQSDATKLRHAKRELGILRQQVSALAAKSLIGQQMSNVMFNLAQRENYALTGDDREMMGDLRRQWDRRTE